MNKVNDPNYSDECGIGLAHTFSTDELLTLCERITDSGFSKLKALGEIIPLDEDLFKQGEELLKHIEDMKEPKEKMCCICGYEYKNPNVQFAPSLDSTIDGDMIYSNFGSDYDTFKFKIVEDIGFYTGLICDQCIKILSKNEKIKLNGVWT